MEGCVETGEEAKFFGGSVDQYFKQLFDLGKGEAGGIKKTLKTEKNESSLHF